MMNFRYHIVSLIAVFLALGVGVLLGISFVAQPTITALSAAQKRLDQRNGTLREDVAKLERERREFKEFAGATRDAVLRGRLRGKPLLLLSFDSTDDSVVGEVEKAAVVSGAILQDSVTLSTKLDLTTDSRRQQLSIALGLQTADEKILRDTFIARMTASLTAKAPGVLQSLMGAGLAQVRQVEGVAPRDLGQVPPPGTVIVLLSPKADGNADFEKLTLVPLIESISAANGLIGVGETGTDPLELVSILRNDSGVKVVTADNVDEASGQTALLMGIEAAFSGNFGHYGLGKGASTLLPQVNPG